MEHKLYAQQLFTTSAYLGYLEEFDTQPILENIYKIKEKSAGRVVSNAGGWQSKDYDAKTGWDIPECEDLFMNYITPMIANIIESTGLFGVPLNKINYWYNVNPPGSYNEIHWHPYAYMSGTFYLKVPEDAKQGGSIVFQRSESEIDRLAWMTDYNKDIKYDHPEYNQSHWFYPREKGVILFPAFANHKVNLNKTDETRISMAFNYSY